MYTFVHTTSTAAAGKQHRYHVVHHPISSASSHHVMTSSSTTSTSCQHNSLCCNSNDATSWTSSSIARLLTLSVTTLSEIIGAGVDNNSAAENALGTNQLDQLVLHRALSIALSIGLEVSEITDVALRVLWCTVLLGVRVDCMRERKREREISIHGPGEANTAMLCCATRTVRSSAGAAVGVVSERVNVHATLRVGVVTGNVPFNGRGRCLAVLGEGDGALDVGVTTENGNCSSSAMVSAEGHGGAPTVSSPCHCHFWPSHHQHSRARP